jgi:hypothetical protein
MKRHGYLRRLSLSDVLLAIAAVVAVLPATAVIVAVLIAVAALFFPWSESALVWTYASWLPWPLSWMAEVVGVLVFVGAELLVLYGMGRLWQAVSLEVMRRWYRRPR